MVLDIEAGPAKFTDPRAYIDNITEPDRLEKIGTDVNQWNPHDAECDCKLVRPDAQCSLEHLPRVAVAHLEETAVKNETGRIELTQNARSFAPVAGQCQAMRLPNTTRR